MWLGVVVGFNHCISLFDAYLIKENHIRSAGGIAAIVSSDDSIEAHINDIYC